MSHFEISDAPPNHLARQLFASRGIRCGIIETTCIVVAVLAAVGVVAYNTVGTQTGTQENHTRGNIQGETLAVWKPIEEFESKIRFRVPAPKVSEPRAVLYTSLIAPHGTQHYKQEDMVLDALFVRCTATLLGSTLPHRIIISGVEPGEVKLLADVGYSIVDASHLEREIKEDWYKPLYSRQEAEAAKRPWMSNNAVQDRVDGWATYFKYLAWNDTSFDVALMTDVDLCYFQNPDDYLRSAAQQGVSFHAFFEQAARRYMGFNTHMMLLRPSHTTFSELVQKAKTGDYIPYTNGEQDVLEWYFNMTSFDTDIIRYINHTHEQACWKRWASHPTDCSSGALASEFQDKALTCGALAEACGISDWRPSLAWSLQQPAAFLARAQQPS